MLLAQVADSTGFNYFVIILWVVATSLDIVHVHRVLSLFVSVTGHDDLT